MRLIEIESWKDDLSGALAKSIEDVPILEDALREAEAKLAAAENRRMSAQTRYGQFVSNIPLLRDKYQDSKRRAMNLECEGEGRDTQSGWQSYRRLKSEYQAQVDSFAYFTNFAMEEVAMKYLEAQIAERVAYAALLEGQAARARCGALVALAGAHAFDPGLEINFSKREDGGGRDSWSNSESKKANEIMTRTVPTLREQLIAHRAQVEQNRADMSNTIWN